MLTLIVLLEEKSWKTHKSLRCNISVIKQINNNNGNNNNVRFCRKIRTRAGQVWKLVEHYQQHGWISRCVFTFLLILDVNSSHLHSEINIFTLYKMTDEYVASDEPNLHRGSVGLFRGQWFFWKQIWNLISRFFFFSSLGWGCISVPLLGQWLSQFFVFMAT